MVCLGNICRSPLAEGILQHKAQLRGLNWKIDSAGTGSWHIGELPDSRSIDIAREHGIDITYQRSRQIKAKDLANFDLIFAMDSSNYNNIRRLAQKPSEADKVQLIMNMSSPSLNRSVPDPYYQSDGFGEVFNMLNEACDAIIEKYA